MFLFMNLTTNVYKIMQPLYKGQLQRLLLNLCAHGETRTSLVKILMDMLIFDTRKPANLLTGAEPPYRLHACQTNVMYSRPQSFDGENLYLVFLFYFNVYAT